MAKINRLKVVLVEKEKSGKWLADQLGKSTCTVSKWCSNTTQPDLQTLSKIAQLLNIDTRELLTPSTLQE
jgi:transcriptional regulator with XRE-family HTH domain